MKHLLEFLWKYNHWLLFIVLEALAMALLLRFNPYQQSVWLSSAGRVTGTIYEWTDGVTSYFRLKGINKELSHRNAWLEERVSALERHLREIGDTSAAVQQLPPPYQTIQAQVIKNSLNRVDNYITLDQGAAAGIRPDMGVAGTQGVVGIVYKVSSHYALVLSVLNSRSNISCMIQGSGYFGYLRWEGGDSRYAWLEDLPRHAEFELGDTVVTSGYSAVFPQGVTVGTVDDAVDADDGLSYRLKIRLATDFGRLDAVRILARTGQEEQKKLEEVE